MVVEVALRGCRIKFFRKDFVNEFLSGGFSVTSGKCQNGNV